MDTYVIHYADKYKINRFKFTSLSEGIKKTYEWYSKNMEW